MYYDMSIQTLGFVAAIILICAFLWRRALTHKGPVRLAEVVLVSIIFILCLGVTASFFMVLTPAEFARVLTAQAFTVGAILMSPPVGLIAYRYRRLSA